MKLEENGERFAEEVKVDVAGQTEEIKVPQHQDRMEVDILNDFNVVRIHLVSIYCSFLSQWLIIINVSLLAT